MDFLEGLNPQQRRAVCHGDGPLLILAGAGSGKTRVITHRISYLIREHRVPGHAILGVTFTNKAADEMRARVAQLLGGLGGYRGPLLSTFHSFCVRLLRADGASLADLRPGFTPQFVIYDQDDQLAVLKAACRRLGLDEKFMPYRQALARISHAKNRHQTPEDFYKSAKDPKAERLAVLFEEYEKGLRQANALDFDDLLLEAVRLLRHDDKVCGAYNQRLEYLLIDEYQDTNRSQYELMRLLTRAHQNVCAVGDEDQSIYGWRGADIRNILDFERDYPGAVTIRLEQNYRSTKNILEAASSLVACNTMRKGKWLWTEAGPGERLGVYEATDAENEALFIADTIEQILSRNPGERVAVLYRTNAQSRQIEEALRRYGREYVVVGGLSFYHRAEIKDVLAYLKLLVNPDDPVSLLRILNKPARGIGRTTAARIEQQARERGLSLRAAMESLLEEKLLPARAHAALSGFRQLIRGLEAAAAHEPLDALLEKVLADTGYRQMLADAGTPEAESRLENLDELINAAADAAARGEGPAEFLDHAALVSESDEVDSQAQVSLLTLHNAKGLEWPVVFICGLEEGLFPHARSRESEALLEEERRLCYVGMTRAQKRLILTWARYRRRFGGGSEEAQRASRFLDEVPARFVEPLNRPETAAEAELFVERRQVRESVRRNTYTGKTYNSLENIAQFFRDRGLTPPPAAGPPPPARAIPAAQKPAARKQAARRPKEKFRPGVYVEHPRYGPGIVLRREGSGEEAKLTVSFPGSGLKKLITKYAGLKILE